MRRDYEKSDTMKLVGHQPISIILDNPEINKGLDDIVSAHKQGPFPTDMHWLAFTAIQYGYIMGKRAERAGRRRRKSTK